MPAEFDLPTDCPPATERFRLPSEAEQAIAGEREASWVIRRHRDSFAQPDELLNSLLNVLAMDNVTIMASPRLRGWCRRLGKALEPVGQ
ncbi:MAG TPA: hypothetical protein PKA20_05725 [Burkholderiaceae bacterium]|nr:hypothetical protein [Burkholderiaceae bacterium]